MLPAREPGPSRSGPAIIICLVALAATAAWGQAGPAEPEPASAGGLQTDWPVVYNIIGRQCIGDIDGDDDTDWSDLAILLADWACSPPSDCIGDLDGDGDTDVDDVLTLLYDWGCPDGDGSCDEPGPGVITVSVAEVDNTTVGPGDDPIEFTFDGGVTHFTFDLQVTAIPDEDWGAAESVAVIDHPEVAEFFMHTMDFYGAPPPVELLATYPALEFDSYWCGATDILPGSVGDDPVIAQQMQLPDELDGLWCDYYLTPGGPSTIARHTIIVPPGGGTETPPIVVPMGTGGNGLVIGTITGWFTNASYTPGCDDFFFDIVYCGPDSDGDGYGDDCDNCPDHYNPDQADCDDDGMGDVCAIADGFSEDCQPNGVPDECDIADGTSQDQNSNGIPDECEGACVGDIDGDDDTDWSDLAILIAAWGTPDGDLNGDGNTDVADLLILLGDWACPDGDPDCDEPGSALITISVAEVDNSSVGPGDDPIEPLFDGGATHFTFDLQVTMDTGEDWGVAESEAFLTDPDLDFFRHGIDAGGHPPLEEFLDDYPALEFDSYWCAATVIPPGGTGLDPGIHAPTRTATELSATWYDFSDTPGGPYTIARHTIIIPPGSGSISPIFIVPGGDGNDDLLVGTITGWVTNTSLNPGCEVFEFDILYCGLDSDGDGYGDGCDNCPDHYNPDQADCDNDGMGDVCAIADGFSEDENENGIPDECDCPPDFDHDWDVDTADLLTLLGQWGNDGSEGGDVDFDGDVDTADLLALLGMWGDCPGIIPCPGDFNGDGFVDDLDLDILLEHLGPCPDPPEECPWDLNEDGVVDSADVVILMGLYGPCP